MKTIINYPNGDCYEGEVNEQGLPHGAGVMKFKKQAYSQWQEYLVSYKRYRGHWKNGVKSGQGKMEYYQNGNGVIEYCGDWENDLPNGKGKLTNYSNVTDMTYNGEWKDGQRHGFGEYTLSWDKGTFPPERYEGEWKDDKRCGKGICWYGRNKDKMYEGDWLNDKREGYGIWKYENGDVLECQWKSGDRNGEGIFTFADGGSFKAEWKDNNLLMDTIRKVNISMPLLLIKIKMSGFDYNNQVISLMKAKIGEYIVSDKTFVKFNKANYKYPTLPMFTIKSVDTEKVEYLVSSEFVEGNSSVFDTITPGEKKKYSYSRDCVATIYDEDYDYTIKNEIVIECK